ncbi:hypothetical protein NECAME_07781 [Necator americanus]|uniref:Uncharacterized protein n=1 Tax=Necator americanus TaxID=51031 RepID=W2TNT9_NECAM|nr:hypothetical protein NECAME_07781 [Necator americanus]ETN82776.1 hypothetical protein NECAME_07781 [Necator americanus]
MLQDDKPYPPCTGHYNAAFDLSQDSTSSEKMESEKGIPNQAFYDGEKILEQNRFDKSNSGSISARKGGPSLIRSLRKESKAKPVPPITNGFCKNIGTLDAKSAEL